MAVSYSIAIDRMPPEEYAALLRERYGYQNAPGAWPRGTRVLALSPRRRGRIVGSYGSCRAPHADEGAPAPIPHFHYFIAWPGNGTKPEAVRSDFLAGHP